MARRRARGTVALELSSRSARYGEIFCSATRRVGDVDGDSNGQHTELFVCCYSSLARDKGEHRDIGFGTKEHMAKVLADINCDKVFAVKGDKTAMRSFYNWPRNMRILLQS